MSISHGKHLPTSQLGDEALERVATTLSDLYRVLYEERPADPRASLTGNMLAFVFEGGLSVNDEWLLRSGRDDRLREFRQNFFEVVSDEMVGVVGNLTGMPVTYSFFGFDPKTRTTHAIFVLDLSGLHREEERLAVLNWSEQVRRNARRLRAQHRATREVHVALKEQMRAKREEVRKDAAADRAARRSEDA